MCCICGGGNADDQGCGCFYDAPSNYCQDTDGDGFVDSVENKENTDPTNSNNKPSNIPQVLTEAKLWLDATNIDGYGNISLSNGSEINNWIDLSGNANNAIQTKLSWVCAHTSCVHASDQVLDLRKLRLICYIHF